MSKNVFANGKEISAKKDGNQSICALPDVCNTPPSPPAGPLPIPYPNTAKTSDTSDGTKTVKIGGAEVGMKNASNYKKSTGDEAATKSLGMNLTTHTIQGKMKHAAWSMDVKVEGANVIRHMDLTTHNHMNTPGTASMTTDQAMEKVETTGDLTCQDLEQANKHSQDNELTPAYQKRPIALTTAVWKPAGGKAAFMKAVSSTGAPKAEFKAGYTPKAGAKDRRFLKSPEKPEEKKWPPCSGIGPPLPGVRVYDSESKIMRKIMNDLPVGLAPGTAGSLKISTIHKGPDLKPDRMSCDWCKQSICGAIKCGIIVKLCNNNGDEVDPEEKGLCKGGKPQPAGASEQSPPPTPKDLEWAKVGLG